MLPKKLEFFINDPHYFRAHRQHVIERLAEHFDITINMPNDGETVSSVPIRDLPLTAHRLALGTDILTIVWIFLRLLVTRPDIVYAVTAKTCVMTGFAIRALRLLSFGTINPVAVFTFPGLGRGLKPLKPSIWQFLVIFLVRLALKNEAYRFTFETKEDCDDLGKILGLDMRFSLVAAGTGLDLNRFRVSDRPREGRVNVLFAGRLLKSKGIFEFVSTAERFAGQSANICFTACGWASQTSDCLTPSEIEELRCNDSINFLGMVNDMPALLATTDIVFLPTVYPEGIPRILIEGAATENVLITYEFGGSRVLIEHGKTGFFLNRDLTVDEIIQSVIDADDRGRKMGQAARARVVSLGMDVKSVQSQFVQYFAKL